MIRLRQIVSYGGIGAMATVAHYGLLVALVELFGLAPVPATLAGFVGGGIVSYVMNRRFTFETTRSHGAAGWRFALVALAGFFATWGLMTLFVEYWGLPYLPMQVVTTLIVVIITFTGHKFFSFGEHRR